MRNAVGDLRPGFAVIIGLVDKRVPVVHLVEVHRNIGGSGIVAGGLDVRKRSPLRQVGNILSDVSPVFAAVAGQLQQTVIGSRPDHAGFFRRFGNGEHHPGIFHAYVVWAEAAGNAHSTLVVARQVGADDLPAISSIPGNVHELAAHIYLIMVVWRDGDGELPVEAIFDLAGSRTGSGFGPHLDIAVLMVAFINPAHVATYA